MQQRAESMRRVGEIAQKLADLLREGIAKGYVHDVAVTEKAIRACEEAMTLAERYGWQP